MKKIILLLLVLVALNCYAQEVEAADTVSVDSVFAPSVPQVPVESCDSLTVRYPTDRYGVVWKDGKCGIYDILKGENVTRIVFKDLWYSFRNEMEGEYYTYFGWDEKDYKGLIGIAEVNNEYIAISLPKEEEGESSVNSEEKNE